MSYSPLVQKHFSQPFGQQVTMDSKKAIYTCRYATKGEADAFLIRYQLKDNCIDNICFKTAGCPYLIATLSFICQSLNGKNIKNLKTFEEMQLIETLQIPKHKWYLVALVIDALKQQEKNHE